MDSVEAYLATLEKELAGCDPAVIQDALADAEEHLRMALEHVRETQAGISEAEALQPILERYGAPHEVASEYREAEMLTHPVLSRHKPDREKSLAGFLGVISEPGAWGAMLYLILSLLTGLIYFSWAVIGVSLSLSLTILIIGLPLSALVLISFRSLALLEGRIVEALLGERMPRRSLFTNQEAGWFEQVKGLFLEPRTWTSVAYLILQLPLGILYFTSFSILLSLSLSFIASPVLELVFDQALFHLGSVAWHVQVWQMPFVVAGGYLLLTGTLHISKFIGRWHAQYAKWLLVGP